MKICTSCHCVIEITRKNKCKSCYEKDNYIKNKEKILALKEKYYANNKDELKQKSKDNYVKNREINIKKMKIYRENNKDKIREYQKQYILDNKDKIKKRKREYEKTRTVSDFKLTKRRIRTLIIHSIKKYHFTKTTKTCKLLRCTYEDFMIHLGPKPEGNYHLDHICPCSQAQNEEELIKLQHYTNFRWLLAKDNILKSDNWTIEAGEKCLELLQREWL